MYYVYVLKNEQGTIYIGHTNNLERRIVEHNDPNFFKATYTRNRGPWLIIYKEVFNSRGEAMQREKILKTGRGRDELKRLLG